MKKNLLVAELCAVCLLCLALLLPGVLGQFLPANATAALDTWKTVIYGAAIVLYCLVDMAMARYRRRKLLALVRVICDLFCIVIGLVLILSSIPASP